MAKARAKRRQGARKRGEGVALARAFARAADDKKGADIVILDLRKLTDITEYFVIATAGNPRHLGAIASAIHEEAGRLNARMIGREGADESGWVLLDFADVVAHVFDEERRDLYDLALLWGDAPRATWRRRAKRPPLSENDGCGTADKRR